MRSVKEPGGPDTCYKSLTLPWNPLPITLRNRCVLRKLEDFTPVCLRRTSDSYYPTHTSSPSSSLSSKRDRVVIETLESIQGIGESEK